MRAIYLNSVFFAYLGMGVTAAQQLLVVPIAVSLFGESGYGLFATYFALAGGVAALLGWLSTASAPLVSKSLHAGEEERAGRLYHTLRFVHSAFALGLIPLALLLFFFTPLLHFGEGDLATSLFLAALLYSVVLIATSVEPMLLFASARADLLNKYRFYSQLLVLILVLAVLLIIPNLTLLFMACAIGPLFLLAFARRGILSEGHAALKKSGCRFYSEFKPLLLSFTSLAGTNSIVRTLLMLDAVFIAALLGAREVTIFTYYWLPANFIILSLWKFSENAQPLFMKAFAEQRLAGGFSIYKRLRLVVFCAASIAAVLYFLLLDYFLNLWVDYSEFDPTTALIFTFYIVFAALFRLDFAVLYAHMKFKLLLVLSVVELVFKCGGMFLLIDSYGFACTLAAQCIAHVIFLQWYGKYLVHSEYR